MSKPVEITVKTKVTKCYDCPYFRDHPYEPDCDHPRIKERSSDAYYGLSKILESRDQMISRRPKNCPIDWN